MLVRVVGRSIGAVGLMLLAQSIAVACSCLQADQDVLDQADTVFFGEVTSVKSSGGCGGGSGPNNLVVAFDVIDAERGVAPGDVIELSTSMSGASCGLDLVEGETWLIYSSNGSASLCSGSEQVDVNPGFLWSDRYATVTTDTTN